MRSGAAPAPRARRRPAAAGRRLRPPLPRRPPLGATRSRRYLRSEAWRHAVEDRQGVQAGNRHARPDAGRAVQQQPERVRRRQHEPAAFRRRSSRSRTRWRHRRHRRPKRPRSCACSPPIGAPTAIASRARRRWPTKAAAAPPADGSAPRSKRRRRPCARAAINCACPRNGRATGKAGAGSGCVPRRTPRAKRNCGKRKAASPTSRRRSRICSAPSK